MKRYGYREKLDNKYYPSPVRIRLFAAFDVVVRTAFMSWMIKKQLL
jgi:hypothetical protein